YNIVLTDSTANLGDPVPTPDLPGDYYNTGESRNGSTEVYFLGEIDAITGMTDVVNQDFGIQRPPNSDDYSYNLGNVGGSDFYTTSASLEGVNGMGAISGSDPEDGSKGSGNDFQITDLSGMNGNKLFYDANGNGTMDPGEELSAGDMIMNYIPSRLSVAFCGLGSTSFSFDYTTFDEAGAEDVTPATYEVVWEIPLPVELTYFRAYLDECTSILKWETATEENNSHFIIEKSTDGREFFEIGQVDGAGNSTEKIRYSFEDGDLDVENSYYRLKQVDFDEGYDYSSIEVIKINSKSKCLNPLGRGLLYPNPNSGKFVFSIEMNEEALATKFYVT
ncbi:MAG: hypothetical protein ACPG5P_09660, partial [Saprospiraceae bacterium]